MFTVIRLLALWFLAAGLVSTSTGCSSVRTSRQDVVARWSDGTITRERFDSWLAFQGINAAEANTLEACTDIATLTSFAREVERDGIDEETRAAIDAAADSVLAGRLKAHVSAQVEISPSEVDAAYEAHPKAFQQPEKIRLRNLFLRYPPDATAEQKRGVREKMDDLLRQIRTGADFGDLAKRESDSQTRFHRGLMGNFRTGILPPAVEPLVMDLEPGGISPVLETGDGLTVFACDRIIEARTPGPEEVRRRLGINLRRIEFNRLWAELKADLTGDEEISDRNFTPTAAEHARRLGLDQNPETAARIRWTTAQILATEAVRRAVEARFTPPTDGEAEALIASEPSEFMTKETLTVSVIQLPPSADEHADQRQAAALSYRLRQGDLSFDQAARRFSDHPTASNGGRLEPMTRRQMAPRGLEFTNTVIELDQGQVSREFMADGRWWIVRLDERRGPQPMPRPEAMTSARKVLAQMKIAELQGSIESERRRLAAVELAQ